MVLLLCRHGAIGQPGSSRLLEIEYSSIKWGIQIQRVVALREMDAIVVCVDGLIDIDWQYTIRDEVKITQKKSVI